MNYTKEERLQLAHDFIRMLNGAMELDADALHALAEFRVPCNAQLAAHPTIQVRTEKVSSTSGAATFTEQYKVGLLGILNGILGVDEHKQAYLAGDYDNSGKLRKFIVNPSLGKPRPIGVPE